MYTRSIAVLLVCWVCFAAAELSHDLEPSLGKPAPTDFESVVAPDGTGLPVGEGSVTGGKTLYATHCVACHGSEGTQPGNSLAGGRGTLNSTRPLKTVGSYWPYATTLFDYVNRAMPYGNEKSLSDNEVYAITAYVLYLNDIIPADTRLTNHNLATVVMPNRDGFRSAPDYQPVGRSLPNSEK
ncbi:MAG TPA: hypothetical protein DCS89_05565 [Gammaproteobacteria bacterium]|jgi:cytochrome c|nr:hypothetical protein [Gammaproteobacteria bacterium]